MMKKFNFKHWNKKTFITSIALLVAIAGVSATVALAIAKSNNVTNSFVAAKMDTSIDEDVKNDLTKKVKVKNAESAVSDAYIRVKLYCSPEEKIQLNLLDKDGISSVTKDESEKAPWFYDEESQYYYYRYSVAPGASTTQLLDSIVAKDGYKGDMEVTVYQESCVASEESHYGEDNARPVSLEIIKGTFAKSTGVSEVIE